MTTLIITIFISIIAAVLTLGQYLNKTRLSYTTALVLTVVLIPAIAILEYLNFIEDGADQLVKIESVGAVNFKDSKLSIVMGPEGKVVKPEEIAVTVKIFSLKHTRLPKELLPLEHFVKLCVHNNKYQYGELPATVAKELYGVFSELSKFADPKDPKEWDRVIPQKKEQLAGVSHFRFYGTGDSEIYAFERKVNTVWESGPVIPNIIANKYDFNDSIVLVYANTGGHSTFLRKVLWELKLPNNYRKLEFYFKNVKEKRILKASPYAGICIPESYFQNPYS